MSFLLGDDYASSSSEEEEESDGEQRQEGEQLPSESEVKGVLGADDGKDAQDELPSVAEVFAGGVQIRPSYLAAGASQHDEVKLQAFDHSVQEEKKEEPRDAGNEDGYEFSHRKRRMIPTSTGKRAATTKGDDKGEPPRKREKTKAKDRVKGQRMRGQAGIGSDFRGWKSETEMALRQQFD